ncbi:unnamed protein product, partial [Musa textilis]
ASGSGSGDGWAATFAPEAGSEEGSDDGGRGREARLGLRRLLLRLAAKRAAQLLLR